MSNLRVPEPIRQLWSRVRMDAAAYFNRAQVDLVPVALQNRPFSRVLRVAVLAEREQGPLAHLYIKSLKPKDIGGGPDAMQRRVARDFDTTNRALEWMRGDPSVGVVPPVACYPEHLTIVTQEVQGATLLDYVLTHGRWSPKHRQLTDLENALRRVGRWIQLFQRMEVSGRIVTVPDLIAYIDHRLQRLVATGRFTERQRAVVVEHVQSLGSVIPTEELGEVTIHADLSLGNVIVDGERVVVLDFAMARLGAPAHDVARLFVQLELLTAKPYIRRETVCHLERAVLCGFEGTSLDSPLFRLLLLLHRINNLATLATAPATVKSRMYNVLLWRQHDRWLKQELSRPPELTYAS